MKLLLRRWNSRRYIGDSEKSVVHDRLTGRCGFSIDGAVRRGTAVLLSRDTLAYAIERGYEPCPVCVPGCSRAKLLISMSEFAKSIPRPPRPPSPSGPPELVPVPVLPRGPLLSAGNAVSLEAKLEREKRAQAA